MLLLLLACSGGTPEVPRPEAARKVTLGTLQDLGSFEMAATIERAQRLGEAAPTTTTTALKLEWQDADHWAYTRARDGRGETRIVVHDGVGWLGTGDSPLTRRPDTEPLRAQVARNWDPWAEALGAYEGQLVLTRVGVETVGERRAERFAVSLAPGTTTRRTGWSPTRASGDVWFDEATAVRVQAQVELAAARKGQSDEITLLLAVSRVGEDLGLAAPETPRDAP